MQIPDNDYMEQKRIDMTTMGISLAGSKRCAHSVDGRNLACGIGAVVLDLHEVGLELGLEGG